MSRATSFRALLSIAVILVWTTSPRGQGPNTSPIRGGPGQRVEHGNDPCDQLSDPSGKAIGIDRNCPQGGGSSGIAKGDFNGDGFADLAISEPGAAINGHANAGNVIVVYGSTNGLMNNTARAPELWYLNRFGGLNNSEHTA